MHSLDLVATATQSRAIPIPETVTLSRAEYEAMRGELETLRALVSRFAQPRVVIPRAGLVVDFLGYHASLDGREIRLAPKEFQLLGLLAQNIGRTVPHAELIEKVWPDANRGKAHLKMLVFSLRQKMDAARAGSSRRIVSHVGIGYEFSMR